MLIGLFGVGVIFRPAILMKKWGLDRLNKAQSNTACEIIGMRTAILLPIYYNRHSDRL